MGKKMPEVVKRSGSGSAPGEAPKAPPRRPAVRRAPGQRATRGRTPSDDVSRQNEERRRRAHETVGLTYLEVDVVQGEVWAAENFGAVMGYPPPSAVGGEAGVTAAWFLDHVAPMDRERVASAHAELLRGATTTHFEYRVVGDDQIERWIETRWSIERTADGTPRATFATYLDITDRKRAEVALLESEERYRTVLGAIDEGFCIIEILVDARDRPIDYRFLDVNARFENQTGLADAKGKRVREMVPTLEDHWFEIYGEVARTGVPVRFVNFAKDLDERWFDVYACRVGGPSGREVALVFNDITQRKRAEEALSASEDRLGFVIDSMPQKIVTAQADGGFDYFNPQWAEFTGLSLTQISVGGWDPFLHPDDRADTTRRWRRSIATGEMMLVEHRFRRTDGQYRWHLTRMVPMRNGAGEVVLWIGSSTDVHEVKEADHRKDEFLAMLGHELRNPLAPIRNLLEVMQHADDQRESLPPALSMMERQVRHMTRLIDDLLDASRISQGKISLRREKVELAPLLRQAVEASRPYLEAAKLELTVSLPAEPVFVDADPVRLAQVFGNLLHNASKFSQPEGRLVVRAELRADEIEVSVRDFGLGIPATLLPRIFELFQQGDQSLERAHGGLGIGLTLVHRLVEMHGGSVRAASEGAGRGSEFVVRLPTLREPEAADRELSAGTSAERAPLPRRILVVDDNEDAAETLAMVLKRTGHETQLAFNGREAVDATRAFRPDLILMDLGMPVLNGFEAARAIREQPWSEGVVLVALTGWGQEEDRRKSAEAGFDGHLVKPVEFAALNELLADFPLRPRPPEGSAAV
jgi:PAS domain S-box-containing protein